MHWSEIYELAVRINNCNISSEGNYKTRLQTMVKIMHCVLFKVLIEKNNRLTVSHSIWSYPLISTCLLPDRNYQVSKSLQKFPVYPLHSFYAMTVSGGIGFLSVNMPVVTSSKYDWVSPISNTIERLSSRELVH